jgi:hypothetical protein
MSERCEVCNQEILTILEHNVFVTESNDAHFFCDDCGVNMGAVEDLVYEPVPFKGFEWEFLD